MPWGNWLPPGHARHVAQIYQVDLWRTFSRYPRCLFEGTERIRWYCTSIYGTVRTSRYDGDALAIDRGCVQRVNQLTYLRIICFIFTASVTT